MLLLPLANEVQLDWRLSFISRLFGISMTRAADLTACVEETMLVADVP